MKILLELILDFTDIYTIYTLYVGLFLGLALKLIFIWTVNNTNIDILSKRKQFTFTIGDLQIQKKSRIVPNHLLVWIIKFIRNKSGTGDDKEATLIFLHS